MSPFTTERENPRDIAEQATEVGQIHDVVVGASKVIHEAPLDEGDIAALNWAMNVLSTVASKQAFVTMPSASELSGRADPVGVLRRIAADPSTDDDPNQLFQHLSDAISSVLEGKRNEQLIKALESVRTIFVTVSKTQLGAEVATRADQTFDGTWLHSMTNSTS
jgi:hypothetical protein